METLSHLTLSDVKLAILSQFIEDDEDCTYHECTSSDRPQVGVLHPKQNVFTIQWTPMIASVDSQQKYEGYIILIKGWSLHNDYVPQPSVLSVSPSLRISVKLPLTWQAMLSYKNVYENEYTCKYTHIHVYTYICIYMYVRVHVYMRTCLCTDVFI